MAKKELQSQTSEIALHGVKLFEELSQLIEHNRQQVIAYANSTLTMVFWQIGKRINDEVLDNQRAEYGKQIVPTVSTQLEQKFGRNFTEKNVRRMMQFAQQFQDASIVVTLSRQLTWSHFLVLIPLKVEEERLYYAKQVVDETLGVRDLRKQIAGKAFERAGIANMQSGKMENVPANTFKDPYLLDFLGLRNGYLEKDIETAILYELETFILSLVKDLLL